VIIAENKLKQIIQEELMFTYRDQLLNEVKKATQIISETEKKTTQEIAHAEKEIDNIFSDKTKAADAIMSAIEQQIGVRRDKWLDENGNMKPEVRQAILPIFNELRQIKGELKNNIGAKVPIEKKLQFLAGTSAFASATSLLTGFYKFLDNVQIWGAMETGLKNLASEMPFSPFEHGGPVDFGIASSLPWLEFGLYAAGTALALTAIAKLIKGGKVAAVMIRDAAAAGRLLTKIVIGAAKVGKMFLTGLWSVTRRLFKGAQEKYRDWQSKRGAPADPKIAMKEIQELQEILNFMGYSKNRLLA
jgi:hypothetical protein